MSKAPDLEALFGQLQEQEEERAKKEAEASKDFSNPNFVSLKVGNAYEVRLMYWSSNVPGERKVPLIEKTVHAVKADDGSYHEITCPSSAYLMGRGGFRACPVCTELSKLWDEKEKGSQAAKIAYGKFKRKFKGYAVVYVVNDPTTPENNGTFKILYINSIMIEYLRKKIYGLDRKGVKIEGARPIGFKAFDPGADGKSLIISVTKDGEYNKYDCEFVDGNGDLKITTDDLEKAFDELKFDEYYTPYDVEAVKEFYEKVYLEREELPVAYKKEASLTETKKETEKKTKGSEPVEEKEEAEEVPEEEEAPAAEETQKRSTPNVDIDSILDDLPS